MSKDKKTVAVMCFSGGCGGMESDAIKLAELLQRDCQVTMFCKQDSFIHQQLAQQSAIKYFDIKFRSRAFSVSMLLAVRRAIRKYKIRNVVFFGASELKTLYFAFLGYDLNVIVRHGTTKSTPKKDWLHRLIYSCVDTHVALSEHLLVNVKNILPDVPGVKFEYIPQSYRYDNKEIRLDEYTNIGKLKLIHIGRVVEGKGHIDAVNACEALYKSDVDFELHLLGSTDDGYYFQKLKKIVDSLPYKERVIFAGHVSNVSEYLKGSDILLFPSMGEGMPNAVIEALHYGVVCITYDNTVFPEFEKMGFYMHLVRTEDVNALKMVLAEVVSNIVKEKKLSSKNYT